jgi:hypothetical protein
MYINFIFSEVVYKTIILVFMTILPANNLFLVIRKNHVTAVYIQTTKNIAFKKKLRLKIFEYVNLKDIRRNGICKQIVSSYFNTTDFILNSKKSKRKFNLL